MNYDFNFRNTTWEFKLVVSYLLQSRNLFKLYILRLAKETSKSSLEIEQLRREVIHAILDDHSSSGFKRNVNSSG